MTVIRPLALAKQLAAIPFHFVQHQWKGIAASKPEKHVFGPHSRQYLMFWMPPEGVPEHHSVVIFYHGGGWRLGWPDQFPTIADWFLRRGFPVIMPAYRLCPQFSYPEMREDLNLALQKSIDLIHAKGLSSRKLLAAGMSAGATLAAHLAFNRNELADICMTSNHFSGFLSFGGPLDLNQLPDVKQLRNFAGGPSGSDAFKAANPITWLTPYEHLPVLLLHGTDDAIVPFSSSESFYEKYSG
jgi:alpha-beta hydrolase superfamily lysophospholipase